MLILKQNKESLSMVKINCKIIVSVIAFIFILPTLGESQITMERAFAENVSLHTTNQTPKNEDKKSLNIKTATDMTSVNRILPASEISEQKMEQESEQEEEEQDMMEKALDLIEEADSYWGKGDVENTLNILDKAYALILDTNGDPAIARQKDDLRLLISKHILSVYSARQTVTNGKASEIPLIMNADVEKEIRSFQGWERDFFISSYQRSGMYRPIIVDRLKKAGIPEELSWLPLVESGFKIMALSRARALGLWQFIPSTGYKFGLSRDEWIDERMDVEKSTQAAIAYLKELHSMFGDWLTVLAAYDCGEGRVLRVISRQHINYFDRFWDLYNQLPNETARYVPRFLATLHIIKDPQKYGMDLGNIMGKPIPYEFVKVNKIMKLQDIATKLDLPEESLNLLNSELRYKITPDKNYNLKIPLDSVAKFNSVVSEIPESEKPKLAMASRSKLVIIKHRVKSGETIISVAKRYRISPSTVASFNNINTKKKLVAGQSLKIPLHRNVRVAKTKQELKTSKTKEYSGQTKSVYKISIGDTLLNVATRFDLPVAKLKEMNNLKSNSIRIGQILKLSRSESGSDADEKNGLKKQLITNKTLSAKDVDKLGTNKYIVTKGDNLRIIAKKNNLSLAQLVELNNLVNDEKITPGQVLIVK